MAICARTRCPSGTAEICDQRCLPNRLHNSRSSCGFFCRIEATCFSPHIGRLREEVWRVDISDAGEPYPQTSLHNGAYQAGRDLAKAACFYDFACLIARQL
jgi:hypothetical protein